MDRHHHQPHWSNFGILGGIFVGATVILTVLAICVDRRRQVRRNYQGKTRSHQWRGESSEARHTTNVRHPSHGARALGGGDNASALGAVTAAGVLIPGMASAAGEGGAVISVDAGGGGGGGW